MSSPVMLAIETSQRVGGVALRDAKGKVHVEVLSAGGRGGRHDDDLIPAIDRAFAKLNLKPRDLEAVGVSIGPGGFTGLRIAISTTKMLAETLHVKLLAVPSALIVAESYKEDGPIVVALASKRNTIWSTRLTKSSDVWTIDGTPGSVDAETVPLDSIKAVIADTYLPDIMRLRCASEKIPITEPIFDPRACLLIAQRMYEDEHFTDALELLPLYAREPEAVTIWEKNKSQRR